MTPHSSINSLPRAHAIHVALATILILACCAVRAIAANAPAPGVLTVKSMGGKVVVTSAATPSWKAVVDSANGGVITELCIPSDGPNIASNDGTRFDGVCNVVYVDFKETGVDHSGYVAKGSLYYYAHAPKIAVMESRPDRVVVTVEGRSGNQVEPQVDVISYRQRYTFTADRIMCEGDVDWLFDDVVPGSRPELIQLNNVFAPGMVRGELRVQDTDTGPLVLLQSNSKGMNYPAGIDYPLTVEVPLADGHSLFFRSVEVPEAFKRARFYWNEYQRQISDKRGFAFKAWEGWPGNGDAKFPSDRPIPYKYGLSIGARSGPTSELPEAESIVGFTTLFNGQTWDGWKASEHWVIEEGKLVYPNKIPTKKSGDLPARKLMTVRQYKDFILRFDFKLAKATNNGIAIRAPLEGDAAFVGMEIQVIDTDGWPGKLKPFQVHGSIYGVVPAKTGHLKPAGEWNTQEITCDGRKVRITFNGVVIVDANLDEVSPIDGKEHPGLKRERGHIGFLGHTGRVEFRNIRVKELPDAATIAAMEKARKK